MVENECSVQCCRFVNEGHSSGGGFNVAVQVEERLVGAVLGPAGRYVEEIKQYRSQENKVRSQVSEMKCK